MGYQQDWAPPQCYHHDVRDYLDIFPDQWKVDGTGSESCPMAGFGVCGVELQGSKARS